MKVSDFSRDALSFCTAVTMLEGCGGVQSQSPAFTLPNSTVQVGPAVPQLHDSNGFATPTLRIEPDGQLKGHLYVASSAGSSGTVERFQIVGGVPESKPDRKYPGVGAPIAVDSKGYLYATADRGSPNCYGNGTIPIAVYALHSKVAVRTFDVSVGGANVFTDSVNSLFVDSEGYAYVGVSWYVLENPFGSTGLFVYSPGASGCAEPVQSFDFDNCEAGSCFEVTGLAMDAQANLHVSNYDAYYAHRYPESVLSFASPTTNPTRVADLTGSGIVSPWGLAIDASDELYIDNSNGTSSFVSVYRAKASGSPPPDREISVTGEQSFGDGIAIAAGRLIIPDPTASVVYAVSAHENGAQTPIWTLSLSSGFSPQDVKLSP